MDRGALALQVNEGNAKLVHLPDPPATESVVQQKVDATLAADGGAQVEWSASVTGVEAPAWRAQFHAEGSRKQRVQQLMGALFGGTEVRDVESGNLEDVEQPVSLRVKAKSRTFGRKDGETVSVPVGPREHFVRDYASLTTRKEELRASRRRRRASTCGRCGRPRARRSAPRRSPRRGRAPSGATASRSRRSAARCA